MYTQTVIIHFISLPWVMMWKRSCGNCIYIYRYNHDSIYHLFKVVS